MSPLGAWCLLLILSCANGEVEDGVCTGDSCGASDANALLQRHLVVVDAIEAAEEPGGDDDGEDNDVSSGDGDSDADCSSFTRGSTCRANGCSWSGAFVGEKKQDGSELSGYICADDEEVEEEVHDKLMNGTGSLIQMLEDKSEITSKGNETRWCRRRRRGQGWSCPYCRRRRAPPPPAKIEANGCPTGLQPNSNGKCPGSGQCCTAGWTAGCGQACVKQKCTSTGGSWIWLNYARNAYTCEMPKIVNPSEYCDEPKGDNAGFDCLCQAGTGYCGLAQTWAGTLAAAQAKCDGDAECQYLHDWKADGNNWRACRKITSPGDGKAAIKRKSSSGSCPPQACTKWSTSGWHSGTYAKTFAAADAPNGAEWTWQQCAAKCGIEAVCEFWTLQLGGAKQCLMMANKGTYHEGTGAAEGLKSTACTEAATPATEAPATPTTPPAGSKPPAEVPTGNGIFDSIDENDNEAISRGELQKAIDGGKISVTGGSAPVTKPPSSGLLSQSQKDAIVMKHNVLRAGLGASDMMKMTWDDALANAAQEYVSGDSGLSLVAQQSKEISQKCPRGHSQNRPMGVGENLAWKYSSSFELTDKTDFTSSIQAWYDEIKDAGPYKTGGTFNGFGECSGTCGHYTQVVWAAANKIGCGVASCPHSTGMPGYMLACQYGTSVNGGYGGNMQGATLFTPGTACSNCPSDSNTCSSKLCA